MNAGKPNRNHQRMLESYVLRFTFYALRITFHVGTGSATPSNSPSDEGENLSRFTLHAYLLLVTLSLLTVGCDKVDEEPTLPVEEIPQQILLNFSTQHTEAGIARWTLVADSAEFLKEITYIQNPTVQIFQDGKWAMTITGDRGEILQSSNDIHVFENVVGKSQDGVLYTDELHWRNSDGKLYAPNESKIVRGDSTMFGREMEGDPALEVVTMKDVRSKIYPKDEKIDATEN